MKTQFNQVFDLYGWVMAWQDIAHLEVYERVGEDLPICWLSTAH